MEKKSFTEITFLLSQEFDMNPLLSIKNIAEKAKVAQVALERLSADERQKLLIKMQASLNANRSKVLSENEKDRENAHKKGISKPLQERLQLDAKRFDAMLEGLEAVAMQ